MIYCHEIRGIDPRTGYGGAFQQLAANLMQLNPKRFIFHNPRLTKPTPEIEVDLFFGMPYDQHKGEFETRLCDKKGIFTMYESERIGYDFVRNVEEYFDFIIVPSRWCKQVFERHFPDHPVYLSPLGVNPQWFPIIDRRGRSYEDRPFTFIWQGFRIMDRKRDDLVQKAFDKLKLPNTRLIIKALAKSLFGCDAQMNIINETSSWILSEMSHADMISLWAQADFGLHPSNSEGVGLIPLEWMTTGMPVAFSNNTGAADYCNREYNYPLECKDKTETVFNDGTYLPSVSQHTVEEIMLHAYENQEAVFETGLKAARWIRREHTYEHAAKKLLCVLDSIATEKEMQCTNVA